MPNPVQTYSGASSSTSLTLTFTTPPTIGNTLVFACYFFVGSGSVTGVTVSDTGGNSWTNDLDKSITIPLSRAQTFLYVSRAVVTSSAGSPFSVTLTLSGALVSVAIDAACFEVSGLDSTQPDLAASYVHESSLTTTFSPASETPSASNDFAVALVQTTDSGRWISPAGWTVSESSESSGVSQRGEIDCQQLSTTGAVAPQWQFGATSSATGQAAFLLYRGAGSGILTMTPSLIVSLSAVLQPEIRGVAAMQAPLLVNTPCVLQPSFSAPSSYARILSIPAVVLPPQILNVGTLIHEPTIISALPVVLQPTFTSSAPPALQLKRGPYATIAGMTLEDGEPALAGVVVGGTVYYLPLVGGHDGVNHAGAMLIEPVSGKPAWTPPRDGIIVWDVTNLVLWVSSGGVWKESGVFT